MVLGAILPGIGLFAFLEISSMSNRVARLFNKNDELIEPLEKVSVIATTLNEGWHIEKTMQSIFEQNIIQAYRDYFEIILIDGYSRDDTVEKALKYDIDKILLEPDKLEAARTKGILESEGEIIFLIDCDRIYPPNYINYILKYFLDEDVVAVTGINTPNLTNKVKNPSIILTTLYCFIMNTLSSYISTCRDKLLGGACAFRRSSFFEVDGFDIHDYCKGREYEYPSKYDMDFLVFKIEECLKQKLERIGKVVCDIAIAPWDNGSFRRSLYKNMENYCRDRENDPNCEFYEQIKKQERF